MVYLPISFASVVFMVPVIIVAEKGGRMKEMFLASIALLALSLLALAMGGAIGAVVILALVGFFTAFNIMEAMLPSLVTKSAPADAKGTATGIYSSLQFLGIFVGGVGGGWANSVAGSKGVFAFTVLVAIIWLILAATMSRPRKYSNYLVHLSSADWAGIAALEAKLKSVPGVIEAVVARDEGVAYLKIDRARFDADAVAQIIGG